MTDSSDQPNVRGVFFLLGASGSGKGTVAKHLIEHGQLHTHRSMGEVLRQCLFDPELESRLPPPTPSGFSSRSAYLRHAVHSGLLIPDPWTDAIVQRELEQISPEWFWAFDGYPRTVGAAAHLLAALQARAIRCLGVVHLHLSLEELERRLLARGRVDDTKIAIANRFEFYRQSVLPTLAYLEQHIPKLDVDASQSVSQVAEQIRSFFGSEKAQE
jgi:adenylate kinase family enzyme